MPKPVIPAIPLPYVKRQAAAAAAAAAPVINNVKPDDSPRNSSLEVRPHEVNQSSPTLIADTPHASESLSAGSPELKSAIKNAGGKSLYALILPWREGEPAPCHLVSCLSLLEKHDLADPTVNMIASDTAKEVVIASSKPVAPVDRATGNDTTSTNYAVQPANAEASAPIAHEASSEMQTKFHGRGMGAVQDEPRQRLGKLPS